MTTNRNHRQPGDNKPVSDHMTTVKQSVSPSVRGSECVPISHESSDWGGKMQHHSIEHGGFSDVNDNVPDDPDLGGGRQSLDRLALRNPRDKNKSSNA